MIIAMITGSMTQYPEVCPFCRTRPNGLTVCGHNAIDPKLQSLACQYINTPTERKYAPTRCPLHKHPVDGIRLEAG